MWQPPKPQFNYELFISIHSHNRLLFLLKHLYILTKIIVYNLKEEMDALDIIQAICDCIEHTIPAIIFIKIFKRKNTNNYDIEILSNIARFVTSQRVLKVRGQLCPVKRLSVSWGSTNVKVRTTKQVHAPRIKLVLGVVSYMKQINAQNLLNATIASKVTSLITASSIQIIQHSREIVRCWSIKLCRFYLD